METSFQQIWIAKLLEFDFTVEYKSKKKNKVTDALLRVPAKIEELNLTASHIQSISVIKAT